MRVLIPLLALIVGYLSISFISLNDHKDFNESDLTGIHWKVNCSPFENPSNSSIQLTAPDEKDGRFAWGYHMNFQDGNFSSSYSAPCGNDCFTSVSGTYMLMRDNLIAIKVDKIQRNGFCSKESEEVNESRGIYQIQTTENGFILEKVQKERNN